MTGNARTAAAHAKVTPVPNLGFGELVVILLIVVLIFGATRLPQIGEGIGKAIKNFKRGIASDDDIDVSPKAKRVAAKSSAEDAPRTKSRAGDDAEDAGDEEEAEIVQKKRE